ncbi:hypothetical protein [Candidatus Poriferisodalis sp.]|uniref:hypothetical protein n=1 Tax=Candidatus Poriferisodalis sp. TaxID=3101277 RepID=UPI003B016BE2
MACERTRLNEYGLRCGGHSWLRALLARIAATAFNPLGELVYGPLSDAGVTEEHVRHFWSSRPYDLGIPDGAGNCVYCFLKGPAALARLAAQMNGRDDEVEGTPVDIRWWSRLEEAYGRPSTNQDGRIGMFHDTDYESIMRRAASSDLLNTNGCTSDGIDLRVPCSCTD